jgi:CheY-like chemotaxis protein
VNRVQANLNEKELERLSVLRGLQIMDTPAEPALDAITRLASTICDTPIALISLVDEKRQWFKSAQGLKVRETPREHAFCAHAIEQASMLQVADASLDSRFSSNPLVTGEPYIRFYAGQPISVNGHRMGTLCVIDRAQRTLSLAQQKALIDLTLVAQTLILQRAPILEKAVSAAHSVESTRRTAAVPSARKVLYVEDNRLNALLLEQLCSSIENVDLRICPSLDEMYRQLQIMVPDLILLDINLPGTSGLDILGWLKRTAATSKIRVIMVSADASAEAIRAAQTLGAEDFWTKPLNLANVLKVLDSIG